MDRSIDGGMAPALQSSTNQSTSSVNQGDEVNEIAPHKKINGNTRKDSICNVKDADTNGSTSDINTAGDSKLLTELDLAVSGSFITNIREFSPTMPAIHRGQGDSSIPNVTGCNGWNNYKRPQSAGILQESSNITNVHSFNVPNKKVVFADKPDGLALAADAKLDNLCNGAIRDVFQIGRSPRSNSPVLRSKAQISPGKLENSSEVTDWTKKGNLLPFGQNKKQGGEDYRTLESCNGEGTMSPVLRSPLRRRRECSKSPVLERSKSPVLGNNDRAQSPVLQSNECLKFSVLNSSECSPVLSGSQCTTHQVQASGKHLASQANRQSELLASPVSGVGKRIKFDDLDRKKLSLVLSTVSPVLEPSLRSRSKVLDAEHTTPSLLLEQSRCSTPAYKTDSLVSPVLEGSECLQSSDTETENFTTLKYTGVLTRGLPNIMSDKLANTLQELAASLKGSTMCLDMDTLSGGSGSLAVEYGDTVNSVCENTVRRSVESSHLYAADMAREKNARCKKEQEAKIETKSKSALDAAGVLDCRLRRLQKKIDVLRCSAVKAHIRREVTGVVSQSHLPAASGTNRNEWQNGNSVVSGSSSKPSSELWQRVFNNKKKILIKDSNFMRSRTKDLKSAENEKLPFSAKVRKLPGNGTGVGSNLSPYVQLTRLENVPMSSAQQLHIFQQARRSTGILKKELQYVMSRCDPYLTDSSSDEEVTEPAPPMKLCSVKYATKSVPKPCVRRRFQKSFCKWVAERAEISRRWSWLQLRLSIVELDALKQAELYARFRAGKGAVQTDDMDLHESCAKQSTTVQCADIQLRMQDNSGLQDIVSVCNSNLLVGDIHHQTSSPSEAQHAVPTISTNLKSVDAAHSCARTRQLRLSTFCNRTLVNITSASLASSKLSRPVLIQDASSIMCAESLCMKADENGYMSLILKATSRDPSYHSVISFLKDISCSVLIGAAMKSKRKWSSKSSTKKRDEFAKRLKTDTKRETRKKTKRSRLITASIHTSESRKRKLADQVPDCGRMKIRRASFSDPDSPVVIGGFDSFQHAESRAAIAAGYGQTNWRKKKTADQAFDIDNIVIPHGFNATRIEKLTCKEIQTPSWKILDLSPVEETVGEPCDLEMEDTSARTFQKRHDCYEAAEKRKYVSYMEWSISRRGSRGSRLGNIREPTTSESASPSSSYTPHSVLITRDPFSSSVVAGLLPETSECLTAKPAVSTQRKSCDQRSEHPETPPSRMLRRQSESNLVTSQAQLYSSVLTPWQDGLGCDGGVASVNRTFERHGIDQSQNCSWEIRAFPLAKEDMRMLNDANYAKMKLFDCYSGITANGHRRGPNGKEATSCSFRWQSSAEKSSLDKMFQDGDQHHLESVAASLMRVDSGASTMPRYDSTMRHGGAFFNPVSTTKRKCPKARADCSLVPQNSRVVNGNGFADKFRSERRSQSESVDDSTSQSHHSSGDSTESDSSYSSEEGTSSYEDAGHVVDDYADPEWEAPTQRHSDRR